MNFNGLVISLVVWVLGAAGLRMLPSGAPPERTIVDEQWRGRAGQGLGLAFVGGMRGLLANACWLRANQAWERQDLVVTSHWIELTVTSDERPLLFWLNGARIMAYDQPEWRRDRTAPAAWQQSIDEDQAQRAIGFLQKGLRWRGPSAELYIELANIHWRRRGDLEQAAENYRLAAMQADAPQYAARIYAELLRAMGRPTEALVWLQALWPKLDAADPLARREVIRERILELESEILAK